MLIEVRRRIGGFALLIIAMDVGDFESADIVARALGFLRGPAGGGSGKIGISF